MIRLLATLATTAIFTTHSHAQTESKLIQCWDGTFAYNRTQIREVADGYEIILAGSTLQGGTVQTADKISFELTDPNSAEFHWLNDLQVLVKAPLGACSINAEALSANCDFAVDSAKTYNTAFVSYRQSDISSSPIASHPIVRLMPGTPGGDLKHVSLSVDSNKAILTLRSAGEGRSTQSQIVQILPYDHAPGTRILECEVEKQSPHFPPTKFPQRLRTFLKQRS